MSADRCRLTIPVEVPVWTDPVGTFIYRTGRDDLGVNFIRKFNSADLSLVSEVILDALAATTFKYGSGAIDSTYIYAWEQNSAQIIRINIATGVGENLGWAFCAGGVYDSANVPQSYKIIDKSATEMLLAGYVGGVHQKVVFERRNKGDYSLVKRTEFSVEADYSLWDSLDSATIGGNGSYFFGSGGGVTADLETKDIKFGGDFMSTNADQTGFSVEVDGTTTKCYGNSSGTLKVNTLTYNALSGAISSSNESINTRTAYAGTGVISGSAFLYGTVVTKDHVFLHFDYGSDYAGSEQTELLALDRPALAASHWAALSSWAARGNLRAGIVFASWD